MTELRLAGLDLTDASSRLLLRYVPHLAKLDLSNCGNISDQTVHTLTSPLSPLRESLTHINLAGKHTPEAGYYLDLFYMNEVRNSGKDVRDFRRSDLSVKQIPNDFCVRVCVFQAV